LGECRGGRLSLMLSLMLPLMFFPSIRIVFVSCRFFLM
jgi:hypothetical protein